MKIIAEIGWNHMGDMKLANQMIHAAANSGATHVKFQTWAVENLKNGPWDKDGRRQIYEKAQLTKENHLYLKARCEENKVNFLTSCFSSDSVNFISEISNEIKIPSTEIANEKLTAAIIENFASKNNHHVYISTGASNWDEVTKIVEIFKKNNLNFTIMHCVSCYPTEAIDCNLTRIKKLQSLHDSVGYSGHYPGIEDAIISIEMGANTIEKHFTIDKNLPGRDNKFALLPEDMKKLTNFISTKKLMTSSNEFNMLQSENEMRNFYRGRWQTSA